MTQILINQECTQIKLLPCTYSVVLDGSWPEEVTHPVVPHEFLSVGAPMLPTPRRHLSSQRALDVLD